MPAVEQSYQGARGLNFFREDRFVRDLLLRRLDTAAHDRLDRLGELVGGRLFELVEAAHQDGKYPTLRKYDRWGARVDEIVYCREQLEARRLTMQQGLLPPVPLVERLAKAYLINQLGEGGIACPLAMTDGLVQLLERSGTPEQKRRWLPVVLDASGPTPLTGGQYVTEKQGGSNVSENETRAEKATDGSWRLTGLKWFCSNPGELWVTTAKPEGSNHVALFLVPRRRPNGNLNDCHILRLKDISGTRGKATAEVEYRGAYAELVGRASHGMALLLNPVLETSRIHVAAGSLGMMRRALLEAQLFSKGRIVLGKPAAELPAVAAKLKELEAAHRAAALAFFEMLDAVQSGDPSAELLVPLLKVALSEAATLQIREARLLMAGNGSLRDFSPLPRLAEDALIQELWEGARSLMEGHIAKALRKPRVRAAFEKRVGRPLNGSAGSSPDLYRFLSGELLGRA